MLEAGDRQQDADEEHDRALSMRVSAWASVSGTAHMLVLVAVNDLADQPDDAEPEQHAHEGRQMRDGLEGGHGDQRRRARDRTSGCARTTLTRLQAVVPRRRRDGPALQPEG